jgi:hypothetical protein
VRAVHPLPSRAIRLRIAQFAKPFIVHDFDDELAMAKCGEAIWPLAKIMDLRRAIEAECYSTGS